jgi:hypothetical protein
LGRRCLVASIPGTAATGVNTITCNTTGAVATEVPQALEAIRIAGSVPVPSSAALGRGRMRKGDEMGGTYEETACEPENRGEEGEGYIGFPLLACAVLRDVTPVEDRAAVERADELGR